MCPFDNQEGIGVTACLLSNWLTNNLLRGIRDMKKQEDRLCLPVSLSFIALYCLRTPCSPFTVPVSHSALILLCCTFTFWSKIPLPIAPSTQAQMHITLKSQSVVMMSDSTHAQTQTAYQTLMQQPWCWLSHSLCTAVWINHHDVLQGLLQVQEGGHNTAAAVTVVRLR